MVPTVRTVLITGCSGFTGRSLRRSAAQRPWVVNLSRFEQAGHALGAMLDVVRTDGEIECVASVRSTPSISAV